MRFTTRQKKLLMFIHHHATAHGFPPTIREIADAIGTTSTSVANYNINHLIRKGYVAKATGKSRTIALTPHALSIVRGEKSATAPVENEDTSITDFELERLRTENQRLRLENERLRKGNKAKLIQLQREVLILTEKVRQLQR